MSRATREPRPALYGDRARWALVQSDSLALLPLLPDHCVDVVLCDPPYGIGIVGQAWDGRYLAEPEGFQAFTTTWAREVGRVLRPGGYLAAFGAPRTVHRLVAGIEEAELEVRDQLVWLYGSGVPKSRRLPRGLGSALKPAYEPIVLARRPMDPATPATLANVARHGTGALNIDAARIERPSIEPGEGFWPPNLALSHEAGCGARACRPACVTRLIDEIADRERQPGAPPFSRLFYAAKASPREREAGLQELPKSVSQIFTHNGPAHARANHHPTVKPLSLCRWLVRLLAPPGGVVLDPFAGSGSTGIAAVLEGHQFVGIEREAEYIAIARARMTHWAGAAVAGEPEV